MSINGDDDDPPFDEGVTKNEIPEPTHPANRPVVRALFAAIAPLQQCCNLLAGLLHEVRTMDRPIEQRTMEGLRDAGKELEGVGSGLREAMGG